ncbi:hypothetical protein EJB05_41571, partial [Eragrostis curvula]
MASQVALLLWRTWFVRNEMVHNAKLLPIDASVGFLQNYVDLLNKARVGNLHDEKGKKTEQACAQKKGMGRPCVTLRLHQLEEVVLGAPTLLGRGHVLEAVLEYRLDCSQGGKARAPVLLRLLEPYERVQACQLLLGLEGQLLAFRKCLVPGHVNVFPVVCPHLRRRICE